MANMFSTIWTALLLPWLLLVLLNGGAYARYDAEDVLTQRMLENMDHARRSNRPTSVPGMYAQNRRFLFSPTIQNTITNLNQNQNTNLQEAKDTVDARGLYSYRNPMTGAVEYDLRGMRPRKICFTLE